MLKEKLMAHTLCFGKIPSTMLFPFSGVLGISLGRMLPIFVVRWEFHSFSVSTFTSFLLKMLIKQLHLRHTWYSGSLLNLAYSLHRLSPLPPELYLKKFRATMPLMALCTMTWFLIIYLLSGMPDKCRLVTVKIMRTGLGYVLGRKP